MSAELRTMLRAQARAAIGAGRPDALALFDAYDALASAPSSDAPVPEPVRLITKKELCALLQISSERTIENWVSDGTLPPEAIIRAGRRVRFDLARVLDALRGRRSNAAASWVARVGRRMRVINGNGGGAK